MKQFDVERTGVTALSDASLFSFSASAFASVFWRFTGHNCECNFFYALESSRIFMEIV